MAKIQWNRIRTWWGESGARFALSQGRRLLLGCVIGPLFGIALHLTVKDSAFQLAIRNKWTRLAFPADGVHAYKLELLVLCGVVVVILLLLLGPQVWRFLRAWWAGITSVTTILTALITTAALEYHVTHYKKTWSAYAIILCGAIALEYWRQRSTPHRRLPINARPQPLTIPAREATSVSADRWKASTSDDPIQNWDEDILGRTAVVELLAEHALTLGTPVVALHGDLGDGKSSVLNLLRKTLEPAAIVVSFNAWLPGNEATFAIDLFRDIATECKKRLYVPQLRKRAVKGDLTCRVTARRNLRIARSSRSSSVAYRSPAR